MMTNGIYLLLGSNLGDRMAMLEQALSRLEQEIGPIKAQSNLYETAAWGNTAQPPFLNQVVEISSPLTPENLLAGLHTIEQTLGRVRTEVWGARTLDLDILYYGDLVMETQKLSIPHSRLHLRRFTLVPLCDIAPLLLHPLLGKTNLQLLEECEDHLEVKLVEEA